MKLGSCLTILFRPIAWLLDQAFQTDFGNCEACKQMSKQLDAIDGKSHKLKHLWMAIKERFGL